LYLGEGIQVGRVFQALLILFLLIGLIFITPLVIRPVEARIHTEECAPTYAVRAGDSFQIIAQRCGVSQAELRDANPHISDPNQIFPGQVLIIPGILPLSVPESISETTPVFISVTGLQTSQLLISPLNGPAGTQIIVTGSGFQPNQLLHIGPALFGYQPVQLYAVTTNASGAFQANLQIPFEAITNQTWVILANDPQTGASASSGAFTVTPPVIDPNIVLPEPVLQIPATGVDTDWPIHIVSGGETLFRIAQRYGTSVAAILQINLQIVNPNLIFPGQAVRIPVTAPIPPTGPGVPIPPKGNLPVHTVSQGETLFTIAQLYGTTVTALLQVNPQLAILNPGQQIWIPTTLPIPPTGGITYVVRLGDTLSSIAAQFGLTVQTLLQLNPQIVNQNILEAGSLIRVG
jgi:LysM repeat protein